MIGQHRIARKIKVAADENPHSKVTGSTSSKSLSNTGKSALPTSHSVRSALGDLSNNARKFAHVGKDKAAAKGGVERPVAASSSHLQKRSISSITGTATQRHATSSKTSLIARPPTRPGRSLSSVIASAARHTSAASVRPLPNRAKTTFIPSTKKKQLDQYQDDGMDISDHEKEKDEIRPEPEEQMIEVDKEEAEVEGATTLDLRQSKISLVEPEEEVPEVDDEDWTFASPATNAKYQAALADIKITFKDDIDEWDMSMVSEYSEEIFEYMGKLETQTMALPNYMDGQSEIEWPMRRTLIDWLLQVHIRYHMLPETLWIAVNIVDRFLSKRVVSLVKLQLVGVTAMFIAAKYEEIMAPSVDEFVYMTEHGYTREEILKGEKIVLQTIEFNVSTYCSPYSWVRRISKADDYDIQTRTLCKFLMEVMLLDHRFLRAKPSMLAAVGMYTAKKMLGGEWDAAFIYYSNFNEEQLHPGFLLLVENLAEVGFESQFVFKKYTHKKFLKAGLFAREWAISYLRESISS